MNYLRRRQRLKMEFLANITGEFTMADEVKIGKKKKKKKSKPSPPPPNPILEANLAEANLTVIPLRDFPPSLVRYLRRSFKNCSSKEETHIMEMQEVNPQDV